MHRPTVLHVVRDWVRPSEGFVSDVVSRSTATRPVVACGRSWPDGPAGSVHGVPVHRVPAGPDDPRLRGLVPARLGERVPRAALAAIALATRSRVVMAHFGYWAAHARAVADRLGLPLVVSVHGHDLLVQARDDEPMRHALSVAAMVAVPSRFLGRRAVDLGVDPARVRVLPSGLDLADLPLRVRTGDGPPTVTFAGRFVAKKGVLDAARAMAIARADHPDLQAVFVGTGPMRAELEAVLADLDLPAAVLDGAPPGALRSALARTDLLLTPSRTAADGDAETLGLVNLEAQAMGVPVVTTRHGGIPEAVAPDGSVLVEEGDVAGLAGALGELLSQPDRWADMGRAGRRHVAQRFELGARVADLEAHLRHLVDHGRPREAQRLDDPPPAVAPAPVTVVMVTHQRRALLSQALDALAAQTHPDVEVVVVDNGTDDGSSAVLAGRDDLDLQVLRSEVNASTSWARNAAAARGTGEVIAFTDDDCRPTPTWLEALVAGVRAGADVVQGRTAPDPAQEVRALSRTQWTPAEYGAYETANIAYTRAAFEAAGGFDEGFAADVAGVLGPRFAHLPFGEDTDLAWRVRRAGGRSAFAATALVHHHVFDPDPGLLLRRAWVAAAFPALVGRIPELRATMLHRRVFLGPRHQWLVLAVAGAGLARLDRRAGLAVVPYLWTVLRPGRRGGRRDRLRAAPVLVARDLLELGALAYGTSRSSHIVL